MNGCCRRCGRDAYGLDGEYLCEDCRTYKPSFDRAASAVYFDGDAREMINAFKFRNHYWLRDDFVDMIEAAVNAHFHVAKIDVILPMPVTLYRRLDRGFNQCAILAKSLAKRLKRKYVNNALGRTGSPRRQGGLDEKERRENVIGTFVVNKPSVVKDHTVLLVDDIMTTGSTLSECAATVKRAGAERVWAITLAHSIRT